MCIPAQAGTRNLNGAAYCYANSKFASGLLTNAISYAILFYSNISCDNLFNCRYAMCNISYIVCDNPTYRIQYYNAILHAI